ncbi:aminoglycoside phosphotransferase family protein [Flindersiella endophytica]
MTELMPAAQAELIVAYHGEVARTWLRELPALVDRCVDRWKLTLLPAFTGGEAGWAAPVVREDGSPAVLKLAIPLVDMDDQCRALRSWNGRGAIRLLGYEPDDRACLLERCLPGTDAAGLPSAEADAVAAEVLLGLWSADPSLHPGMSLADWCEHLAELMDSRADEFRTVADVGPFYEAARLYRSLPASAERKALLHGDFHRRNLLRSGRGWLAIDPMPRIGDPAFDVGQFLRIDLGPDSAKRADAFADRLGLDRKRQRAWLFAVGTQAASWHLSIGDRSTYQAFIDVLAKLM